jgi:D-3-phosphoglycerate dehydrogenase / 2-oxoglutarate reductase
LQKEAFSPQENHLHTILVADHLHDAGWAILNQADGVRTFGPFKNRSQLFFKLPQANALIIRSTTQVDEELLTAAPRLKVVARAGAQIHNIDIDAATRLGIIVINAPDANIVTVAEHTFAMMLALARKLPLADHLVRRGKWPRHNMLGFQLDGKIFGIIGFGRLGQEVAKRALVFGMKVLVYDPYKDLAYARAQGVEMVDFNELLARANLLSLHTAYTSQTHHLINRETLAKMKPGACLINCAHAGLVDEAALVDALTSVKLAGAAIDTFAQEPPPRDHPLFQLPNVVVAPHLNQNTVEAQSAVSSQVAEDVLAALRGEDYRHVVNLPFHEGGPEQRAVLYRVVQPYINLAEKLGKLQGQLAEGWITRLEVEVLGEGLRDLVRPITAVLLAGMLRPVDHRPVNWVSAPVMAHEQGISMAQAKGLVETSIQPTTISSPNSSDSTGIVDVNGSVISSETLVQPGAAGAPLLTDYPNLIACRIYWDAGLTLPQGHRTIAGVLFGNGEARLVLYDHFQVDAVPEGYVLVLENLDAPGVIGKVGTRLGQEGINIAQWRYGREAQGLRAVSFINLDSKVPQSLLRDLEKEPEIQRARLVNL